MCVRISVIARAAAQLERAATPVTKVITGIALPPWLFVALAFLCGCNVDDPGFVCDTNQDCRDRAGHVGSCTTANRCAFADASCTPSGWRYGAHAGALANTCVLEALATSFVDAFNWTGPHAAVLVDAASLPVVNSVFFNPDAWDSRTGMEYSSYTNHPSIAVLPASATLTDGVPNLASYQVPAPGGFGLGVMQLHDTGIATARLRNPGLISAEQPLVIDFYANAVVTDGHFWEIVLTPATVATSADLFSNALPIDNTGDFVSLALRGDSSLICGEGLTARFVFRQRTADRTDTLDTPVFTLDTSRRDALGHFALVVAPNRVDVYRGVDGNPASLELFYSFPVNVLFTEVYVHLMGTALQASYLPADDDCGDAFTATRLLGWRALSVTPVKYDHTVSLPRQQGTQRTARQYGFATFDLRDLEHIGVVNGLPQPNEVAFEPYAPGIVCSGEGPGYCNSSSTTAAATLGLELTQADLDGALAASLVYDVRGEGSLSASINDNDALVLPGQMTVLVAANTTWVRRSVPVAVTALLAGLNSLRFALSGEVDVDRVELELFY